jgi:hypothetical protein
MLPNTIKPNNPYFASNVMTIAFIYNLAVSILRNINPSNIQERLILSGLIISIIAVITLKITLHKSKEKLESLFHQLNVGEGKLTLLVLVSLYGMMKSTEEPKHTMLLCINIIALHASFTVIAIKKINIRDKAKEESQTNE